MEDLFFPVQVYDYIRYLSQVDNNWANEDLFRNYIMDVYQLTETVRIIHKTKAIPWITTQYEYRQHFYAVSQLLYEYFRNMYKCLDSLIFKGLYDTVYNVIYGDGVFYNGLWYHVNNIDNPNWNKWNGLVQLFGYTTPFYTEIRNYEQQWLNNL